MRDQKHYNRLLNENPNASVGFTLAAHAVYAAKHGTCDGDERNSTECQNIARALRGKYGETLTPDEVRAEMSAA